MEASVIVSGTVRKDERAPSGYELTVKGVKVVQNPADDYPISKKEHGIDFLLENRHLWLRSSRPTSIMRIRDQAITSFRAFFHERGFLLIDTPILTGSIGESAGTLFTVPYFDLGDAYLAQTGQLYLEAACMAYGKVYNFGPTFRAEKSKTRRHLTEFWMLEAEVAYADNEDNMRLQEDMVSRVVSDVLANCADDLKAIERDIEPLKKVTTPFIRMDYGEGIKILRSKGSTIEWGNDMGGEDETVLTKLYEKPIFLMNYPKKAKAFYMKENPANPETVLCSDLLAPEGYGEIIGGSQREDILEKLLSRIHEEKLPEDSLRLVPRPSQVRLGAALGLRDRAGADPRVDLRQPAPAGVHPVPADDLTNLSVSKQAPERLRRKVAEVRGQLVASSLHRLHDHPHSAGIELREYGPRSRGERVVLSQQESPRRV